jgi:hypothetical protein
MEDRESARIQQVLDGLAKRDRRLGAALIMAAAALLAALAALALAIPGAKPAMPDDGILTLRGLVIVDDRGVERVRIQAPLPDPVILGKRFVRGGAVSGILLFDDEGNERSGYVTSDGYPNVFLTLDSLARQHVLFIAEPQGDPTLRLWDGASVATLSASPEGPSLKLESGKEVLTEFPSAARDGK